MSRIVLGRCFFLALLLSWMSGCASESSPEPSAATAPHSLAVVNMIKPDQHSFAEPHLFLTRHIDLDLDVDFERRVLSGTAVLSFDRPGGAAATLLYLDTRHLEIRGVSTGKPGAWRATAWSLEPTEPLRGQRLVIPVGPSDEAVSISYATTDQGTGLQWLEPSQTTGKRRPFLFSQSQAIHARTWIPCQDTPGVRVTYTAKIRCPKDLAVVMSANRTSGADQRGEGTFELGLPIPSYLIAVAVGDLEFKALGPRSGVWSEPAVLATAATEFEDTERMIRAVEKLYGPYRWTRYDILVLPPSFPFGGMENPLMTFATPTILAGDKSGVSLIAHELAHSWSGNLVTNATWRDFWLNEGFTVYLEQRIMEEVFGRERYEMEVMLGMNSLREEMAALPPADQILHVNLEGRDPDDGFTQVPYEKGAAFLRLLENLFTRPVFDTFLRAWFDQNSFRSVTTEEFLHFLRQNLFPKNLAAAERVDLNLWIEQPGLPAEAPDQTSTLFTQIDRQLAEYLAGRLEVSAIDTQKWSTHEWLRWIHGLGAKQDAARLRALDAAFQLTRRQNAEITAAWLELGIRSGYRDVWPRVDHFLSSQGRRKFLKPLYVALAENPETKGLALAIYEKARPLYHAIAQNSIDEVLGLKKP